MKDIVTLEFAAHRRRLSVDRDKGWTCICGKWTGFKQADFFKHVTDAVTEAVAKQMLERVERWSPANYQPDVSKERLAGFTAATDRLRKVLEGCTCRPGMIGHWDCPLDDGDLE